jgi:putative DNA primase/helicase
MWKFDQLCSGRPADENADQFDPSPKAEMISASAITPMRTEWLWPGRIPMGMLTLFSGDPKLGKSLASLALVAAVTRGGPLPGVGDEGPVSASSGSAILLSAEDDPARTIVPRLRAAGADLDRAHIITRIREPEFRGFEGGPAAHVPACERMPTLSAQDIQAIERRAVELGDCRLIVFDPITAYVHVRGSAVRRALEPLREMAERLGIAVLLITHLSKQGASGTNGKYRVRDSIDYVGVARTNFLFLEDPDDPSGRRRLMLDNGRNLGAKQPGLPFVVSDDGDAPRVEWLPETIDLDANAALARAVIAGKASTSTRLGRRHACEEWLRGYLAGGPRLAKECEQAAVEAGFNRGLVERARIALAIRSVRVGFGKSACYQLCLPGDDNESSDRPESDASAHAPQFSTRDFRVEHVEHERLVGSAPLAG